MQGEEGLTLRTWGGNFTQVDVRAKGRRTLEAGVVPFVPLGPRTQLPSSHKGEPEKPMRKIGGICISTPMICFRSFGPCSLNPREGWMMTTLSSSADDYLRAITATDTHPMIHTHAWNPLPRDTERARGKRVNSITGLFPIPVQTRTAGFPSTDLTCIERNKLPQPKNSPLWLIDGSFTAQSHHPLNCIIPDPRRNRPIKSANSAATAIESPSSGGVRVTQTK